MEEEKISKAPFATEMIASFRVGSMCYIPGTIYTARDTIYLRLAEVLKRGEETPFDSEGRVVHYVDPCPTKPR